MKKFLPLFVLPFVLNACEHQIFSTAQDFTVNIKGTEAAYCNLYTRDNRYALNAPGKTLIERDEEKLTVDCSDNLSERRRVVTVDSFFSLGYWNYPDSITVDFSKLENGTIKNGYRDENGGLTEKSFSFPLDDRPSKSTFVLQPLPSQQTEPETTLQTDTFESFMAQDILMVDDVTVVEDTPQEMPSEPLQLQIVDEEPPLVAIPQTNQGTDARRRSYPVQLD
jgi:hypothetical protein